MMNSATICGHCKRIEHCRMFLKDPHAVVTECGRYEETDLHKSIRDGFTEINHKKRENAYRLPNDIYDRKYDRPISKEEVKKKLVGENRNDNR